MAVLHHARRGIKHLGSVSLGGGYVRMQEQFTRPNDTVNYAVGDLVANTTVAGSVAALRYHVEDVHPQKHNCGGIVEAVSLRKSGPTGQNDKFRVHLYDINPACANGDNGAWLTTANDSFLGSFEITIDRIFSDGGFGRNAPLDGPSTVFEPDVDIYALVEARTNYAPLANEVFTITLQLLLN